MINLLFAGNNKVFNDDILDNYVERKQLIFKKTHY